MPGQPLFGKAITGYRNRFLAIASMVAFAIGSGSCDPSRSTGFVDRDAGREATQLHGMLVHRDVVDSLGGLVLDPHPTDDSLTVLFVQDERTSCNGLTPTILAVRNTPTVGSPGPDVIVGTNGPDEIDGRGGDDVICGLRGADKLNGGGGNDIIHGNDGADSLFGQGGDDTLEGHGGNDVLLGGDGFDILQGGSNSDTLRGEGGDDTLSGGSGSDLLDGGNNADVLDGGGGNDRLLGGGGGDQLNGGGGSDVLDGEDGADLLWGGRGIDSLYGGGGKDELFGEDGEDLLDGGTENDLLRGGAHNDRLKGGDGRDRLFGGSGNDVLFGGPDNDRLRGGDGDDDLFGDDGNDDLKGQNGNDYLHGSTGDDALDGGPDVDECVSGGDAGDTEINCDYTLTVSAAPAAGGSVTVVPNLSTYTSGTVVQLTANANTGYGFTGWTGDHTSSNNPTSVTMNADMSVTATFGTAPILQTPSVNGTSITLTWTFSWPFLSATGEGYRLEESTTSPTSGFTQIQVINGRDSPESVTLTRGAGTYYYRVRAYVNQMGIGYSPYSAVRSATVTLPSQIQAYASYDNLVLYNSLDASKANTVYQSSDNAVGCNYAAALPSGYNLLCGISALRFDVQQDLAGRSVQSATLRLHVYQLRGDFSVTPQMEVAAIASNWNPATLTWNSLANNMYFYNAARVVKSAPSSSVVPVDFDVTTIVSNWASSTFDNYGVVIWPYDYWLGSSYPGYSSLQATSFQSLEYWWAYAERPLLIVQFSDAASGANPPAAAESHAAAALSESLQRFAFPEP